MYSFNAQNAFFFNRPYSVFIKKETDPSETVKVIKKKTKHATEL